MTFRTIIRSADLIPFSKASIAPSQKRRLQPCSVPCFSSSQAFGECLCRIKRNLFEILRLVPPPFPDPFRFRLKSFGINIQQLLGLCFWPANFYTMPSSKRYTVLIVPGSWHVPAHYESLTKALESDNISVLTLTLPTCDLSDASISDLQHPDLAGSPPSTPWPDMYADAHAVRKELLQLVEAGHSVLLVAHSYGGLPASEALTAELSFKSREKDAKAGGVIGFFAIASYFLPPGMTTVQAVGGKPLATTPEQVSRPRAFLVSPQTLQSRA